MGRMIEGRWSTEWYSPDEKGRFVRDETRFRGRVEAGGPHPPEAGRYHLYVSLACPWAHRTLILRKLRGLQDVISASVVDPHMGDDGWAFGGELGQPDPLHGSRFLREVYARADARYTGRVTVPVLWDRKSNVVVNNESREIGRMLDHAFPQATGPDFCPPELREAVDAMIDANYETVNNGVYKAGFAVTQEAYDEAVAVLFDRLDALDALLSTQPFLCGERVTEADWFLFTTLVRFDVVYYGHFKCNRRHLWEYPHIWRFARTLYLWPGVAETCDFQHMKQHYYWSHPGINPTRVVPEGPQRHLGTG